MKTLLVRTVLGASSAAVVALTLSAGQAYADHRHHHHHPKSERAVVGKHKKSLPVAKHDHGFAHHHYDVDGKVVHRHSGYGANLHLAPQVSPHDKHHNKYRYGRNDFESHTPHHVDSHHNAKHLDANAKKKLFKKKKANALVKVFGALASGRY